MTATIDLQNDDGLDGIPPSDSFQCWVEAALRRDYRDLEQTIRIVDERRLQAKAVYGFWPAAADLWRIFTHLTRKM